VYIFLGPVVVQLIRKRQIKPATKILEFIPIPPLKINKCVTILSLFRAYCQSKFLDLWKDNDPSIAEVEDAKKRVAGLKRK
jgi:hypothetical protein